MIQYRVFKNSELNPFPNLDAENFRIQVDSSPEDDNVVLTLNNVKSLNTELTVRSIRYIFTVGRLPDDIKNYMFCPT
jgi:hypothetical protein